MCERVTDDAVSTRPHKASNHVDPGLHVFSESKLLVFPKSNVKKLSLPTQTFPPSKLPGFPGFPLPKPRCWTTSARSTVAGFWSLCSISRSGAG